MSKFDRMEYVFRREDGLLICKVSVLGRYNSAMIKLQKRYNIPCLEIKDGDGGFEKHVRKRCGELDSLFTPMGSTRKHIVFAEGLRLEVESRTKYTETVSKIMFEMGVHQFYAWHESQGNFHHHDLKELEYLKASAREHDGMTGHHYWEGLSV